MGALKCVSSFSFHRLGPKADPPKEYPHTSCSAHLIYSSTMARDQVQPLRF